MAKQAKTENMPVVTKSYGFTECKPVNTIIDRGYIDKKSGNFIIKELDVEIPKEKLADFIQHALTRALTQDTSGNVSTFTIDAEIAVWQAGYPCLPAWRRAQRETSKLVTTVAGKTFKLPFGRMLIEGKLRDILGPDDARVKKIESLNDELFLALIEAKGGEGYLSQALTQLADEVKAKLEAEKASLLAEFGDLGL